MGSLYFKIFSASYFFTFLTPEIATSINMLYAFFWVIPRRLNFTCQRFGTLSVPRWNRKCSETLAYKIQTPGNCPEESIQHSEHGGSLKLRINQITRMFLFFIIMDFEVRFTVRDSSVGSLFIIIIIIISLPSSKLLTVCRIGTSELLIGFKSILKVSSALPVDALQCLIPSVGVLVYPMEGLFLLTKFLR
jgi:hypothetical protein